MPQNGQAHVKNLSAFAAIFLKCVWQFWDMRYRVNEVINTTSTQQANSDAIVCIIPQGRV